MQNENLLSQVYDQIAKSGLGLQGVAFQLFGTPAPFNWAEAPIGQIDATAYQIMSQMPLWSPVANFSGADARFFDSYRQIFSHVVFNGSPAQQQALKDAKEQEMKAMNALTKANGDMNQAYLAAKQNGGVVFAAKYPDISSWLNGPDGAVFNKAIESARTAYSKAQDFAIQLQQANMPMTLQQAMDAIKKPTDDPASASAPEGWVKVADGSGVVRWAPEWKISNRGADWRASLSKGSQNGLSVSINSRDTTSSFKKSWASGTTGYDTFFWGISGSGGWERSDWFDSDSSLSATISVQSSTRVRVDPGSWYDGGFMRELARSTQGPAGQGYSIVAPWTPSGGPGSSSLFGQYGILSTRVAELIVVYKPSFSISMSSKTYQAYRTKFEASGGLRIGPFRFGGDGGSESSWSKNTATANTFSGESNSEDPLIIGVIVGFPGTDAAGS